MYTTSNVILPRTLDLLVEIMHDPQLHAPFKTQFAVEDATRDQLAALGQICGKLKLDDVGGVDEQTGVVDGRAAHQSCAGQTLACGRFPPTRERRRTSAPGIACRAQDCGGAAGDHRIVELFPATGCRRGGRPRPTARVVGRGADTGSSSAMVA